MKLIWFTKRYLCDVIGGKIVFVCFHIFSFYSLKAESCCIVRFSVLAVMPYGCLLELFRTILMYY